jgi:ribulose-5-phosphate 4-epimerase/fuculose-1-phosphate aldolase
MRGLFVSENDRLPEKHLRGKMSEPDPTLIDDLVDANRILYNEGIVDGFGHVSVRHDKRPDRFFISRNLAPGLVTRDDILELDLEGETVDGSGRRSYLERYIHSEIFRAHPAVTAVVHTHSPTVVPFSATGTDLRPMSHMGCFLGRGCAQFEIRDVAGDDNDMLISSKETGAALARTLGDMPVALLRGHGMVAVAPTLKLAVYRAYYTETDAKSQTIALQLGPVTYLNAQEGRNMERVIESQIDRPWLLWKRRADAALG